MSLIGFIFRRISSSFKSVECYESSTFQFSQVWDKRSSTALELLAQTSEAVGCLCAKKDGQVCFLPVVDGEIGNWARKSALFREDNAGLCPRSFSDHCAARTNHVHALCDWRWPCLVSRFWNLASVKYRALQAHNRCFTVAYPGAHLALRCCFKSWPTSQRCARFCPPCDLLDELNPRPWWDAFTRAGTRTRTGFSIRNAGGACAQRARPKKACALQGRK